jgi:hypothetical protein
VVSKNDLPLIGVSPVERETSGERTPEFAQPLDGFFAASIAAYLELTVAGNPDFDLVAFLQRQGLDYGRGQSHSETISPLRYLHDETP